MTGTEKSVISINAPINFIWLDSVLPNSARFPYRKNVERFCELNPTRKVILWYSPELLEEKEKSKMEQMLAGLPKNFVLKDIKSLRKSTNQKMQKTYKDMHYYIANQKDIHFADNLLKIMVLHGKGGFYFNINSIPVATIPEVEAPNGFLSNPIFQQYTTAKASRALSASLEERSWKYYEMPAQSPKERVDMEIISTSFLAVPPNSDLIDKLLDEEYPRGRSRIIASHIQEKKYHTPRNRSQSNEDFPEFGSIPSPLFGRDPLDPKLKELVDSISLPFFYIKPNGTPVPCVQLLDKNNKTHNTDIRDAELSARATEVAVDRINEQIAESFGEDFASVTYKSYNKMHNILSYKKEQIARSNFYSNAFIEVAFNPTYPLTKEQFDQFTDFFSRIDGLGVMEESNNCDRFRFQINNTRGFRTYVRRNLDFDDLARSMLIVPVMIAEDPVMTDSEVAAEMMVKEVTPSMMEDYLFAIDQPPVVEEIRHLQDALRYYCKSKKIKVTQPNRNNIMISIAGISSRSRKQAMLSDVCDLLESLDQRSEEYLNKAPNYLQLHELQPEDVKVMTETIQSLMHHQEQCKTRKKPEKKSSLAGDFSPELENPSGTTLKRTSSFKEQSLHSDAPSKPWRLPKRSDSSRAGSRAETERDKTKSKHSLFR